MAKKKRKRDYEVMRFRKNDPAHNLIAAAQHWAISQDSYPVVMGGIGILEQGGHRFQICIGCVGKKPVPVVSG